jgi:hypothetical protein
MINEQTRPHGFWVVFEIFFFSSQLRIMRQGQFITDGPVFLLRKKATVTLSILQSHSQGCEHRSNQVITTLILLI